MIRNITLKVNGRDFSERLSTYRLHSEVSYTAQLTSINGVEHRGDKMLRDVLTFALFPADSDTLKADRRALEAPTLTVDYTDPNTGMEAAGVELILTTDLESVFLLNSVDGKIYYSGQPITLRARRPR